MKTGLTAARALFALVALGACDGGETPSKLAASPSAAEPAAPAAPAPALAELPAPWNEANLQNGKSQFNKCQSCHTIRAKDGNLVGPNLHGVFERRPGSKPGFRFSKALQARTEDHWTPEMLDQWLTKPTEFVPGTAMTFNGIGKPENRRDLIAYLMIESRK